MIEQAKAVLKQFLPRYNRRFQVPAQCPDPAFRPLPPDLHLSQVLCFKHKRRVARDNTVKFQRHTLQLLPDRQRRSYAGTAVVVLQGLDGRLSLQHEGRIIAAQEGPQVQDRCETASSLPQVMPSSLLTPKASVNLGKRPLIH